MQTNVYEATNAAAVDASRVMQHPAITEAIGSATYSITFDIHTDAATLTGYNDQYLASLWHIAQANPAEFGDAGAGELVEKIGREIIRRWLGDVPPALWNHQGRDHLRAKAMRDHVAAASTATRAAA